jgi:hypothetical protein
VKYTNIPRVLFFTPHHDGVSRATNGIANATRVIVTRTSVNVATVTLVNVATTCSKVSVVNT